MLNVPRLPATHNLGHITRQTRIRNGLPIKSKTSAIYHIAMSGQIDIKG